MKTISFKQFKENLKNCLEKTTSEHEPIKVSRKAGKDFVIVSAEDWEQAQESLYVLQNRDLIQRGF